MGGVIKAGKEASRHRAPESVAFNLEDVSDKANGYLENVRRQAAALVAEARKQAAQVSAQAQQEGRQAAVKEAELRLQSKLDDQLSTLLPALQKVVQDLEHSKHTWLRHWEAATVRLAIAIAERVIRRELERHPEISLDWVREALTLTMGRSVVKVELHPDDHAALRGQIENLADQMRELGTVSIVTNAQVSRGGCRVLTEFGEVDQQLQVQLSRLEEELT